MDVCVVIITSCCHNSWADGLVYWHLKSSIETEEYMFGNKQWLRVGSGVLHSRRNQPELMHANVLFTHVFNARCLRTSFMHFTVFSTVTEVSPSTTKRVTCVKDEKKI